MKMKSLVIAAGVAVAAPAYAADLETALKDGCVTPLMTQAPLAKEAGLPPLRKIKPRALETGKRWQATDTLVMAELGSGGYRGCKLSYDNATGDERFKSRSAEEAQMIVDAYKAVADDLTGSGAFTARAPKPTAPGVEVTAIEAVEDTADGKKVVVYVYHDTNTNFAYVIAADNGNAGT